MVTLACLCAALTAGLVIGPDPARRLPSRSRRSRSQVVIIAVAVVGGLIAMAIAAPNLALGVVAVGSVGATAGWLAWESRGRMHRRRAERDVIRACTGLAGSLRAGEIPAKALEKVASERLDSVVLTQSIGGDVPKALRTVARTPGCEGLRNLADAWQMCERTGAPISEAAMRVAEELRRRDATQRLIEAELSTARSTGKLFAVLPFIGVGMGYLVGSDPARFLFASLAGRVCLVVAICLACAGLVWTHLLAHQREVIA